MLRGMLVNSRNARYTTWCDCGKCVPGLRKRLRRALRDGDKREWKKDQGVA